MWGVRATAALVYIAWAGTAGAQGPVDLDGRPLDPLEPQRGIAATVLLFTATDCPISNRYAPEVVRLRDAFASRGVRFHLVYANAAETPGAIRAHAARFEYGLSIVRDPAHVLVAQAGASITPEAAVFDASGQLRYRGRIDDRYVDFGVDRPAPTRRDLADALAAVLDGRPVAEPVTRAVGCFIPSPSTSAEAPVTFARDVAPILFDRCGICHRPGGAAPFSLLTYEAVRPRAAQIAAVTESRYMPPWKVEPGYGPFVGQRPLSAQEIGILRRWADAGAPEGDRAALPATPTWPDDGWQLGTPDLVVSLDRPYMLPAAATDVFRIFVIPLPVTSTRYVRGIEFRPGNPKVVHHANLRIDRTGQSRKLDEADPVPGYEGLMPRSAEYPDGHFLGWTPGQLAPLVPAELAWGLQPGTDLVVQLHMQPSGAVEEVAPSIGFFFSDRPPHRAPAILRLGSQGIDIPPGRREHAIQDAYVLPVDADVLAIQPHAHYRAREIVGEATAPDGSRRTLLHIRDWDFRWQHVYRFETPVRLPKGTTLSMRFTYDNSADNPRNPQQPPERVLWGQRSVDEMGDLWFQLRTDTEADRARLNDEAQRKMMAEDIVGYETMLLASPDDSELHDDVALLYLAAGRYGEAVTHFARSVALRPGEATAHFNLATALTLDGRFDRAVASYKAALAIKPDYASAHNNLGMVMAATGRRREAIAAFREAVRHDGSNVQAVRNLAWQLAVSPTSGPDEIEEAVALAERAVRATGRREAHLLDVLAVAYAAAGRFDRARAVAGEALSLDLDPGAAAQIRARLALYERRQPYREP
ncbi:MAG: tetratricopeptide repeat protein [Acidobacteriota bacterium]